MPKQIDADTTFDDIEDEILYTQAALKADEDAEDLLSHTDDWLGMVDDTRVQDREVRRADCDAEAARVVANGRLDGYCTSFGDELYLDCGKDRKSARWRLFFSLPVGRFIRQRFSKQVATVFGWFEAVPDDPLLASHREPLEKWAKRADKAIVATRAVGAKRGQNWVRREELAEDLTRERDALHEALAARARERKLPRSWPDLFFRRGTKRRAKQPEDSGEAPAS